MALQPSHLRIGILIAVVHTLAILLQGCQYDPYAHQYTTVRPRDADVLGRYVLTNQTVTQGGISDLQGRLCVVELRADGTFIATNLPPSSSGSPRARFLSTLVSGSGTWHIESVREIDNGIGKLKTHWGIYLDSHPLKFQLAGLTGKKAPYGMIFTLGDPDSGTVMILEKTN